MDPCRSNIGGPDPCDPCGVDAYGACAVTLVISYTIIVFVTYLLTYQLAIPDSFHNIVQ